MDNLLDNVFTLKEASELWNVDRSGLAHAIFKKRFNEGEVRKSRGTWLITKSAMVRIYGQRFEMPQADNLYTIGYEGKSIDDFINILRRNNISTLFDVRELPLSRKKGFSKTCLNNILDENNISYIHMKELGSPKKIRDNLHRTGDYKDFFDDYRVYLNCQSFNMEILKTAISDNPLKNFCLMCFEKEPQECHRSVIAERLYNEKITLAAHNL